MKTHAYAVQNFSRSLCGRRVMTVDFGKDSEAGTLVSEDMVTGAQKPTCKSCLRSAKAASGKGK